MKKSEKQMIAILIVIAIIIVGVLAAVRLRKDDETTGNRINTGSINTNTNTNNSSVSNEPEEEFVSKQEDGTRVNTSTKLHETKTFKTYQISGIQLTEINNKTDIVATVKNTGSTTTEVYEAQLRVIDKDGKDILPQPLPAVFQRLEPGEEGQLLINATYDFANAYDYILEEKAN